MEEFTEVVVKATGVKQMVPTEWLDHPILGAKFELPPKAKAEQATEQAAAQSSTQTPATAPVADKTPAAGDDKEN